MRRRLNTFDRVQSRKLARALRGLDARISAREVRRSWAASSRQYGLGYWRHMWRRVWATR